MHIFTVYTFAENRSDYPNLPPKVKENFAVYGVLGTGTFGEVRIAFEKVSFEIHKNLICTSLYLNNFSL